MSWALATDGAISAPSPTHAASAKLLAAAASFALRDNLMVPSINAGTIRAPGDCNIGNRLKEENP
jgi:hypothetical protein